MDEMIKAHLFPHSGLLFRSSAPLLPLCLAACLLVGCGPKDIGTGTADRLPPERPPVAETMRYPITGSSSIQQRLYYMNQPAIMEQTQRWRMLQQENAMRRSVGLQPLQELPSSSPDVPKQRSPFRQ